MPFYDISLPISPSLPVWPGDPPIELKQVAAIAQGANANVSHLSAGVHIGTHVDAPHHFLDNGQTVEQLPLEALIGLCYVVQYPDDIEMITAEVLERTPWPSGTQRVLFGTRNSKLWARGESRFVRDFVAITEDGAEWLVAKGVRLVGVDYLSVAPFGNSRPTHRILLEAGVVILEGVNLSDVARGFYDLYCLPLKLIGSDGAPARAVLKTAS